MINHDADDAVKPKADEGQTVKPGLVGLLPWQERSRREDEQEQILIYELIHAHQGRLDVEPDPGA